MHGRLTVIAVRIVKKLQILKNSIQIAAEDYS
jgi:hypothetical protein